MDEPGWRPATVTLTWPLMELSRKFLLPTIAMIWPFVGSMTTMPELLARVKLAMARFDQKDRTARRIETSDLLIDLDERRVSAGGREQHLAIKEFELLRCLVLSANRAVSHDRLLQAMHGTALENGTQSLRVHIRQLRKKLEPTPERPRYIRTESRIGYRFQVGPQDITLS